MTTYTTMIDRIDDELDRGGDMDDRIDKEIISAVAHYAPQRFWFNEANATAVTVAGQTNLAIPGTTPGEVVEILHLDLTDSYKDGLTRINWELYRKLGGNDSTVTSGRPTHYAYFADQLWFFPTPGAAYALTMSYVKRLADSNTNAWATEGEALIRARAKACVEIRYLKEEFARQEYLLLMQRGEPYMSGEEKSAHLALLRLSRLRRSSGRLVSEIGASGGFNIYRGY